MPNIQEILARANSLRHATAINSINPERAGGIMYDTLVALNDLWLSQGAALVISKIYASVAAMQADTSPVSDLSGRPLLPGQIVVIASSDSDNGSVYRYNGTSSPRWTMIGNIGGVAVVDNLNSDSPTLALAARQGKVLDEKFSQLSQDVTNLKGAFDITPSINLFDKSQPLEDGYINSSGGISSSSSSAYKHSYAIPIVAGHYYLLSGRNLPNSMNVRCLDENGTQKKVRIASTGNEYSTWALPDEAGTRNVLNGQFLAPTGAVSFQFNAVWNNEGDVNQVMLIDLGTTYSANPPTPEYQPYGDSIILKESTLPSELDTELTGIHDDITTLGGNLSAFEGEMGAIEEDTIDEIVSPNLFDKSQAQVAGYINGTTGAISGANEHYSCSYLIPIKAGFFYYLSGRTAGMTSNTVRCLDSNGNPMKVLIASTGEEFSTFSLPTATGTGAHLNGQFKTPAGAVYFQFTWKFNDVGTDANVMLVEIGDTYIPDYPEPEYVPYGETEYKIKESALPEGLGKDSTLSLLNGKTIRIFGGSVSRLSKTFGGDAVMSALSGCIIQNDGLDGGGYARGTEIVDGQPVFMSGGICDKVNTATAQGQPVYDIYLLWSSTNDTGNDIGEPTDYTNADNYDVNKLTTQCGGMNYCIKKLQEFAPGSRIIIIGSMKNYSGGMSLTSKLKQMVDAQEQVALLNSLPFYSLWANSGMNWYNHSTYFTWTEDVEGDDRDDGTHPNKWAYQTVIGPKLIKQIALLW